MTSKSTVKSLILRNDRIQANLRNHIFIGQGNRTRFLTKENTFRNNRQKLSNDYI
jgi:hypothetical protein